MKLIQKFISFKKEYKEKNKIIVFFKNAIEKYIIMKKNKKIEELEKNKIIEIQFNLDKKNINKTLYENSILAYNKNSFKNNLLNTFEKDNNTTFVFRLIKSDQ